MLMAVCGLSQYVRLYSAVRSFDCQVGSEEWIEKDMKESGHDIVFKNYDGNYLKKLRKVVESRPKFDPRTFKIKHINLDSMSQLPGDIVLKS
jgi:hypothetical protein